MMDLNLSSASGGAACSVLDVLPYLGGELRLQGLACLASSSRQLRRDCIELAGQNARALLLAALPAVSADKGLAATAAAAAAAAAAQLPAKGPAAACRCQQPVLWFIEILPSYAASSVLAAADVVHRLVHIPHVPLQQAGKLAAAGVHISYAQLLAAARNMVAGLEV
jgi:hypothetical protein